ncbi:MAG: hypothetical protein V4507_12735 [Verrucomicrobiota bacterium]
MNKKLAFVLGLSFMVKTVCYAADSTVDLSKAVGPIPLDARLRSVPLNGYLKVYTSTDEKNDGDIKYYPHSNYDVYCLDGKRFTTISNSIGIHDEEPVRAELPKGTYIVRAGSDRDGIVKIPVVIEAGKTTVLNLEDRDHGMPKKLASGEAIRLPSGQVVGWRSKSS